MARMLGRAPARRSQHRLHVMPREQLGATLRVLAREGGVRVVHMAEASAEVRQRTRAAGGGRELAVRHDRYYGGATARTGATRWLLLFLLA